MEIEEVREGGLWADHHRNSATHSLYLVLLNLYVAESIHVVHNEPHEEKKKLTFAFLHTIALEFDFMFTPR